jgi:hypothetical protein
VITHLNGEPRLQCDGCYKIIEKDAPHIKDSRSPIATLHFHDHACEARFERNRPQRPTATRLQT